MPLVSVIIPTYRHADLVLETLNSVFAQNFMDYEVIVVNDGSPDNTGERLFPLAEAGRIRYFEQPNAGQAAARTRGLAEAGGKYIAFLDDDDLWPADKLSKQVDFLESRPQIGVVGGNYIYIDANNVKGIKGGPSVLRNTYISYESLFAGNPFCSPGQTLVRASIAHQLGGFRSRYWGADDLDFWMRASREAEVWSLPEIALYYRLHTNNASHNLVRMAQNCALVFNDHLAFVSTQNRALLRRKAYRYLNNYVGQQLIARMKQQFRDCDFISARNSLIGLQIFLGPASMDPVLAKTLVRGLLSAGPFWYC